MYDITMKQQYTSWLSSTGTFSDADSLPPVYSFSRLKQLIIRHIHTHCRLEADDWSVILVPGTTLTQGAIECVSSNLRPCLDPYHALKHRLKQPHIGFREISSLNYNLLYE